MMIQRAQNVLREERIARIGRPPIPHEHGAWVILSASLVIGFSAAGRVAPEKWILLTLAVTGAFLAREALGLLLHHRSKVGNNVWLGVYAALCLAGTLPLLLIYDAKALLIIGTLVVALFGLHSRLLLRGRLDRSQWGELLGVGALTLTAPAAYTVSTNALDARAWLIWAGCLLYFSSIFYVKMLLRAVKVRKVWSATLRGQVGRDNLLYHALLTIALLLVTLRIAGSARTALLAAYAPALLRAFRGWIKLTPRLPNLKGVGLQETLCTLWFTGCFLVALRALR